VVSLPGRDLLRFTAAGAVQCDAWRTLKGCLYGSCSCSATIVHSWLVAVRQVIARTAGVTHAPAHEAVAVVALSGAGRPPWRRPGVRRVGVDEPMSTSDVQVIT
jgi:hypothetical protein